MTQVSKTSKLNGEGIGPSIEELRIWLDSISPIADQSVIRISVEPGDRDFDPSTWSMALMYTEPIVTRPLFGVRDARDGDVVVGPVPFPEKRCGNIMRHKEHDWRYEQASNFWHCPGNDDGSAD